MICICALGIVTFEEHEARSIEGFASSRVALIRRLKGRRRASLFRRNCDCYHRQSRYMKLGSSGYGYSSIVVITTLRPHCHSAVWHVAIVTSLRDRPLCVRRTAHHALGIKENGFQKTRINMRKIVSENIFKISRSKIVLKYTFLSVSQPSFHARRVFVLLRGSSPLFTSGKVDIYYHYFLSISHKKERVLRKTV